MAKQHYTSQLTEEEQRIKQALKKKGEQLQHEATVSKDAYALRLASLWDQEEKSTLKTRLWSKFKLPQIFVPATIVALGLFVFLIQTTSPQYLSTSSNVTEGGKISSELDNEAVGYESLDSMDLGVGLVGPSRVAYPKTFKERFLDRLGQHEAAPDDIAAREQVYEHDLHIDLMTTEKHDDINNFIHTSFKSLGGFVETADTYQRDKLYIKGKLPTQNLEAFKIIVRDFVGDDKYYNDQLNSYNRTADTIVIEEEYKKVEESIAYLEATLARESNPDKRAKLESSLDENRAYLREREATKDTLINRTKYADVDLTITLLPTFWKASSLRDFQYLYIGFGEVTLLDKFKINITAVILLVIHSLSYIFWLIPIIWLWWRKSHGAEPLLKELE